MEAQKTTKIQIAIENLKSDERRIDREIVLLQRELNRVAKTIDMLEGLQKDKQLA